MHDRLTFPTPCRRNQCSNSCSSKPAAILEEKIGQDRRQNHEAEGEGIAQKLFELRHVLEIHAVDGRDERGRKKDDGSHREYLDDSVLFDIDHAEPKGRQKLALLACPSGCKDECADRNRAWAAAAGLSVATGPGRSILRVGQTW